MTEARNAARTRVHLSFAAAVAALAAAILIGLVGGSVTGLPERVPASGDSYTLTAMPSAQTGAERRLAAGGSHGGAAITFLKFDVTLPEDRVPRRAWLWLGVAAGPLPELVELSRVPDTGWQEQTLTAAEAPRLGEVVASVFARPDAPAVAFDVTRHVRSSGQYAFAVTAPTSTELARFVAREAIHTTTGPPTITLEWSLPGAAEPSADPSAPWGINPPPFTPSPREISPSPVVSPWPSASPGVTATAALSEPPPTPPSTVDPVDPTPAATSAPPATDPPASEPPATDPPVTGPPVTDPPATDPPATDPPATLPPTGTAGPVPSESVSPTAAPSSGATASPSPTTRPPHECVVGLKLVPSCGALWGVAPGAHTAKDRTVALADFERLVAKPQLVYHAYMRGNQIFPTQPQIALARDPDKPRILFLNWKPLGVTWAQIANGDPATDAYLARLAEHIKGNFPEQFFFTVHHEPENEVRERGDSGMTAKDYAAAFRYVIRKLRADGVSNLVSTMCYMAYVPWNVKPWFEDLYPGDDVVDWVSWDIYAYSDPGYGFGDFAEMMNRRSGSRPGWPGFYNWAAFSFPGKPLMVAEWGVWYSPFNPGHQAQFFTSARLQLELFPRVKAYVYFESPNAEGRDSRVHHTASALRSFQQFSAHPAFGVRLTRRQAYGREVSPWSETAPTPRPLRLSLDGGNTPQVPEWLR